MLDTEMLIGSKFVAGTGEPYPVLNARTGETIAQVPEASAAQVEAAVAAADKAFRTWSRTTPAERAGLLLKLADAIDKDADGFAAVESLNCGKPLLRMRQDEMPVGADCFRYFAGAARTMHALATGEYIAGFTSMVRRDPIGVIGSITP